VADAIEEQYVELAEESMMTSIVRTAAEEVVPEPIWAATREEALGVIGAGRDEDGRMRIGGELVASADAVADLEKRLETARLVDLGEAIDESFRSATTFGLRDLTSIRDVIVEAWNR